MVYVQRRVASAGRGSVGKSTAIIAKASAINHINRRYGDPERAGILSWDRAADFTTYFNEYTKVDQGSSVDRLFSQGVVRINGSPVEIPILIRPDPECAIPRPDIAQALKERIPWMFIDTAGDIESLALLLEADKGITHYELFPDSVNRTIVSDKDERFMETFMRAEYYRITDFAIRERIKDGDIKALTHTSSGERSKMQTAYEAILTAFVEDYLRVNVEDDEEVTLETFLRETDPNKPFDKAFAKTLGEWGNNHARAYLEFIVSVMRSQALDIDGARAERELRKALAHLGFSGEFLKDTNMYVHHQAKETQMASFVPSMVSRDFNPLYVAKFARDHMRRHNERPEETSAKVLSILKNMYGSTVDAALDTAWSALPKPEMIEVQGEVVSDLTGAYMHEDDDVIDAVWETVEDEDQEQSGWTPAKLEQVLSEVFGSDTTPGYLYETYQAKKKDILPHLMNQSGVAAIYEQQPINIERLRAMSTQSGRKILNYFHKVRSDLETPFGLTGNKVRKRGMMISPRDAWAQVYERLTDFGMQRFGIRSFVDLGYLAHDDRIQDTLDNPHQGMDEVLARHTCLEYVKRSIDSNDFRGFYGWKVRPTVLKQSWVPSLRLSQVNAAGLDSILRA